MLLKISNVNNINTIKIKTSGVEFGNHEDLGCPQSLIFYMSVKKKVTILFVSNYAIHKLWVVFFFFLYPF